MTEPGPDGVATETLHARTEDGVRLQVERVTARGGPTRGAVLMVHGLGSTSAAFRVPGASLADHLALRGHDCFVAELRGAGRSERPRASFGLGEYLAYDVPALLRLACEASGQARLTWVGHSMGGILMLLHGIDRPDAPVERLITIGSSLDYRPGRSVYRTLRRWKWLAHLLPVLPFSWLAAACVPFAGWGPRFLPEGMNFHRPNSPPDATRYLLGRGFSAIQTKLLDDLDTTFSEQGFTLHGRAPYLPRASALAIPTLLLGGTRDVQCPPEASEATYALLTGARARKLALFGKAHGQLDDYGHFDLIMGRHAQSEVWPAIDAFLAAPA